VQPQLTLLKHVLVVEDGTDSPDPQNAARYEEAINSASAYRDFDERSPDDLYCAYTGGTTGMPKGVLWRQEDIFFAGIGGGDPLHVGNVVEKPEGLLERIYDVGLCALPIPPFMHVSAHWLVFAMLLSAGKIVIAPGGGFDPATIWSLVGSERVNVLVIVGDAMGRPLVEELETRGDVYDVSTLMVIGSGGAVLSAETKSRLTARLPNTFVVDGFGSSETGAMGNQASSASSGPAQPLRFPPSENTAVFDDDLRRVEPGSDVVGRVARTGHIPLGYHKDPEKTSKTFVEVEGRRWVMPGDFATVEADGSIVLRGRGSVSINTGGEKVFPEEVESALKAHPAVFDVVVVGVPDDRWGEHVTAVVQARADHTLTLDELQAFARERIAGYKVPRDLVLVEKVERQPSGKPDYRWARDRAIAEGADG
jgi:acyl-CoA synthetase (AMP-forming)/AMP-acid ligase II